MAIFLENNDEWKRSRFEIQTGESFRRPSDRACGRVVRVTVFAHRDDRRRWTMCLLLVGHYRNYRRDDYESVDTFQQASAARLSVWVCWVCANSLQFDPNVDMESLFEMDDGKAYNDTNNGLCTDRACIITEQHGRERITEDRCSSYELKRNKWQSWSAQTFCGKETTSNGTTLAQRFSSMLLQRRGEPERDWRYHSNHKANSLSS